MQAPYQNEGYTQVAINPTQQFKSVMRDSHQSHSTRQLLPKNAGYNDMVAEKTQSDLNNSVEQLGGAVSRLTPPRKALALKIN